MPTFTGRIIQWNEEDGCGVIQTSHESSEIPFTINGIQDSTFKPFTGEKVTFDLKAVAGGRLQAYGIHASGVNVGSFRYSRVTGATWFACFISLLLCVLVTPATMLPLLLYIGMSIACVVTLHRDKLRHRYKNRVSGIELLIAELLGGWPGSRIIQTALNHPSQDEVYVRCSGWVVSLHIAALSILALYVMLPS
ncbi:DUF1294 domain-containing protein [Neptunomonas phycophila]|uniref:hypothetical protein n=1 Tax=Neptunomonas phycophila TaxID=1572645 RepID=UPI0023F722DB|nr:hypothetical protein [Neptunomonas phycophila]